ncbi:MAG: GntR family transcriptional regulator [Planctomycetes bacterium]|nr:GntR family transcriptional regulator [Planctomycetota bacterium]
MNPHDGSSVADRAYQHIRSRVLNGQYPSGQQLVTRQIASELGASLNPVREAIGRLAAEGLLNHVKGAGAFVPTPDPESILELYEFRQAIEPFAVRKAAQMISDAELGNLRNLCEQQRELAESLELSGDFLKDGALEKWFAIEEQFHRTLIRAARNRHIESTIGHSRVLIQMFHGHHAVGLQVNQEIATSTWKIHLRIIDSLAERDGNAAATLMLEALDQGARSTLAAAQKNELASP